MQSMHCPAPCTRTGAFPAANRLPNGNYPRIEEAASCRPWKLYRVQELVTRYRTLDNEVQMMRSTSNSPTTTIDAYLSNLPAAQRNALEKLRAAIRAAAPKAEEGFSYGLPAFKLNGKPLVGFGASAKHCAFYPMSGHTVAEFQNELSGFETSKGTVRFQPEKPIPVTLVRKMVKARIAEING